MTFSITRTNSENPDYITLVCRLDSELVERYGELQKQYVPLNKSAYLNTVVIAYVDGKACGCGVFKPYNNYTAEIKRMYVDKEVRGQGIARKMLAELEQWAKENEYSKLILETGLEQPEAISLYKKSGYIPIKNYAPYDKMANSLCFEKLLADLDL